MSKMDGLRAMREAKYAQAAARAAKPATAAKRAAPPPKDEPPATPPSGQPAERDAGPAADRLCGHRAISGRTCTREPGHAAKSHRYS